MQLVPDIQTQRHRVSDELEIEIMYSEHSGYKNYTVYLVGESVDCLYEYLLIFHARIQIEGCTKEMVSDIENQIEVYCADRELCEHIWNTCREPKE